MTMSRREMMLRVLAGKGTPSLPWAPRLDLWYLANRRAGTLPAKFHDASLIELVDEMGWGYHAILPNFKDVRGELDEADRGLGIYNLWNMPCRTVLEGVQRRVRIEGWPMRRRWGRSRRRCCMMNRCARRGSRFRTC